jgi:hypothetical protein
MTKKDLELLWQIEQHCERCIRAGTYFVAASDKDSGNLWSFTQNCYAETTIIHWCKIFGSYGSEPTHFKHFFEKRRFHISDGTIITLDTVRKRLRDASGLDDCRYMDFWKGVIDGRNMFFVHNEFSKKNRLLFPNLNVMQQTCLEMREIIRDVLSGEDCSEDSEFFQKFRDLVQWNRNSKYLRDLEKDCEALTRAINAR